MAKKIIRLTESDLEKIVRKVIQEQKIDVLATVGSSPEGTIGLENKQKVLTVTTQSGRTQKFIIETTHPVTVEPKPIYMVYKGDNVFHLGKNKVEAKIIKQLK